MTPIKIHDYAVGVMAAFGSVVEHIGRVRGLPAQTMALNRRHCMDVKSNTGRARLVELLSDADVLVSSQRPARWQGSASTMPA
jgi:hypothetical protein